MENIPEECNLHGNIICNSAHKHPLLSVSCKIPSYKLSGDRQLEADQQNLLTNYPFLMFITTYFTKGQYSAVLLILGMPFTVTYYF
jgi:hypothetical protein